MRGACLFTAAVLAAASITLAPATAAAQRHCGPARLPAELPAVDAVVDSAEIATLIAGSGAEGVLRFSIVADVGEAPRVFAIGAASPATRWVTPRVEAALRGMPKPSVAWGVRLVASADSTPVLAIERSEYCRPQLIPGGLARVTMKVVQEPGSPRPPRQLPITIYHVSSAGDVRNVTFMRSPSRELESEIRRVSMARRYHPARIDGVAIASVDTIGRR